MPTLKALLMTVAMVAYLAGAYLILAPAPVEKPKPASAVDEKELQVIDELAEALNSYDSSRVREFFTDPVVVADTRTSRFYITIIVTLLSTINAHIEVLSCAPEEAADALSCRVRIFSDLHRAAQYAPSVGTFHLKFDQGSVAYIKEGEFYNDIIGESSDRLKLWLESNYPGREKTIWDEKGLLHNMLAFVNWALYWVRCQLQRDITPGCP